MAKSIAPFVLSALLFILVFVLVIMESDETFLMLIFLGSAIFLAGTGIYLASQGHSKE
jgi:predicted membrane channel-forming protein YqfA (hemolysin III family)